MYRPTRKLKNLKAKLARKQARSRVSGNKAKRWAKQIEQYESLAQAEADQPTEEAKRAS